MAPNPRPTFPRVVTGGTWSSVWQSLSLTAQKRRGQAFAADGTLAPPLTNGDLAALVQEWRLAAGSAAFPLWSQWAAVAYGWDPAAPGVFITTSKQRDALLDVEAANDFWLATYRLALDLDDGKSPPRFDIDSTAFDDRTWQDQVKADLLSDGASVKWELPVGCRGKDGKVRPGRLGCKQGWTLITVKGRPMCRNDATGETEKPAYVCEGDPVTVKDPVTVVANKFLTGLLILGALVWLASQQTD